MSPSIILRVVLFPAPLGPRKPYTEPTGTFMDSSLTRYEFPLFLLRLSVSRI